MNYILSVTLLILFSKAAFAEYCVASAFKRLDSKESEIINQANPKIDELKNLWKNSYSQANFSHKNSTVEQIGNSLAGLDSERRNQFFDSYLISLKANEKDLSKKVGDFNLLRNQLLRLSESWENVAQACLDAEEDENYNTAQQNASEVKAQAQQLDELFKAASDMRTTYAREINFINEVKKRFADSANCP